MRKFVMAACFAAGCARGGASADSAATPPDSGAPRDSTIVAGPPAVPTTSTPATTPVSPVPPASRTQTPADGARPDSVRGIVSVVGTSFEKRVMIAEQGTQRRIEVAGSLSGLIGHVAGADVMVSGMMSGARIDATRFLVRSVDGQPAMDGTLKTENGVLYIVTAGGTRTRIVSPPPPLVGQDGARVWITGNPASGVSSFGFIDPPR